MNTLQAKNYIEIDERDLYFLTIQLRIYIIIIDFH